MKRRSLFGPRLGGRSIFGPRVTSIQRRHVGGGSAPAFDPLSLEPHLWLDPSDLSTLFQDSAMTTPVTADGDPVGAIRDKSGNGFHAIQSTSSLRPVWHLSEGIGWTETAGDGSGLGINVGSVVPQPIDRVSAWRRVVDNPGGSGFDWLIEGGGDSSDNIQLAKFGDGSLGLYGALPMSGPPAPAVGTDFVAIEHHDGASSSLGVDADTPVTGTTTTDGASMFYLHARNPGQVEHSSAARFYGLVQFNRSLVDDEIALLRSYLAAKQGREL